MIIWPLKGFKRQTDMAPYLCVAVAIHDSSKITQS